MSTIKISELSVGDWVNIDDPLHSGAGQIVEIRSNIVLVQVPSCVVGARLGSIEPIPLTPEILESNGFEKVEPQWYMCEHNGIHISVIVWENQRGRIEISYTSPFDDDNPLYIADFTANIPHIAVHHLQRILQLAGVGKEIK